MPQEIHQVTVEVRLTIRGEAGLDLERVVNDAVLSMDSRETKIIPDHYAKRKITSSKLVMSDYST